MKDFDQERSERKRLRKPLQFKIGGETFHVRSDVRPDVIAAAEDIDATNTAKEVLEQLDQTVLAFVDPKAKAHARYRALRERDSDPITLEDIFAVVRWLVSEYTARPTQPSRPSSPGRGRTTTRSTGSSRSRATATA